MNARPTVLLVDDEEFIRRILARIVAREGYEIEEAADGQEALDKLSQRSYDFVISDIRMPGMDGMELLKETKTRHPETAVVLITAYAGEYTPGDALAAGADGFISKPFKNIEIAQTLATLAEKRKKANARPEAKGKSPRRK